MALLMGGAMGGDARLVWGMHQNLKVNLGILAAAFRSMGRPCGSPGPRPSSTTAST